MLKPVLNFNDLAIVLDLRKTNGHPSCDLFDPFWEEVQAYFDEINLAVDERRHTEVLHMPVAVSIRHLKEVISERLHPDSMPATPSCEWLRLQLWPPNPFTNQAITYTGRFKVKFGVEIHQLRKEHSDSHYVNALLQ